METTNIAAAPKRSFFRTPWFILALIFIPAAAVVIVGSIFRPLNGERMVIGDQDLAPMTAKMEELCMSLPLPAQNRRTKTEIQSEAIAGTVTNEYTTASRCTEIDDFYRRSPAIQDRNETATYKDSPMFFWTTTHTEYESDNTSIAVDCREMPDIRGSRYYTVACHWERLPAN